MTTRSDFRELSGTVSEYANHMQDLWGLRSAYSKLAKDRFDLQGALEKQTSDLDHQFRKSMAVGVEIADELRRLVGEAKANLGHASAEKPTFLGRMFGRKSETKLQPADSEWIDAFERLWGLARNRLESIGVEFVELLGKDLNAEEIQGQPVKRFVSVKNKPDGVSLIVKEEIQGLWVFMKKQQILIVQRGEVLV